MLPHLHLLGRGLDELDDKNYIDFDTRDVPVLVLLKQEKDRFHQDEFEKGLISANEYRALTGRKTLKSDLADSLLINPNLTPIANTEKPFKMQPPQPEQAPPAPGGDTAPAPQPAEAPATPPDVQTPADPTAEIQAALSVRQIEYKADNDDALVRMFERVEPLLETV